MLTLDQLKRNVFPGESGGDYGALYGYANRPGGPFAGVNLQDMTVNEVLQFTDPSGPYAQWVKGQVGHVATPVGAFQTVGSTLRAAVKNMGLTGNEKFNQPVQDAIGMWIYQNQGPQAWVGWGKGGGNSAPSNNGGQPMGLLSMSTSGMPEQPKPTFWDKLGEIGPMLMMMDPSTRDAGMAFAEMNAVKAGKAEQKAASNRTIEWLRSQAAQYPQLAPLLGAAESGSVDMGTVVNTAFQVIQEANKPAAVSDVTYGLTPQRYVLPDGTVGLGVLGNDGTFKEVALPEGATPAPNVDKIDAGDRWLLVDQMGVVIGEQPKNLEDAAAATERGKAIGTAQGEAITGEGGAVEKAMQGIALIESIKNDPALASVVGNFQGRLPAGIPFVTGGQAGADVGVKIEQLQGKAFLEAFETLKGGGQITEREGAAAQAAIARLQRPQSEAEYLRSLNELQGILQLGVRRAQEKASSARGETPAQNNDDPLGLFE